MHLYVPDSGSEKVRVLPFFKNARASVFQEFLFPIETHTQVNFNFNTFKCLYKRFFTWLAMHLRKSESLPFLRRLEPLSFHLGAATTGTQYQVHALSANNLRLLFCQIGRGGLIEPRVLRTISA